LTNEEQEQLASQLRKPKGNVGLEVAEFMNKGNELLNRNTIKQIKSTGQLHIVELGMGNGRFVDQLFEQNPAITYSGCDYSWDMVHTAEDINQKKVTNGQVQFHHCDASQLPFQSNSVDVIFTVNTLYFWADVVTVLQEFKRVLKKGGQLLIGIRPKHLMEHYPFVKFGFSLFTADDVKDALNNQGFQTISALTTKESDFVTDEITFPLESLVVGGFK
jgi:ubiquinone/menaquinone biosynthesis C-methylase UbiE